MSNQTPICLLNSKHVGLVFLFCFLLNIQAHAQFRWAKSAGCSLDDYGAYIKPDNHGNFYVAGYFYNTMNFDSAGVTKSITSAGYRDIFVAKFNCSRNLLWVNRIGGTDDDRSPFGWVSIDLDSFGHMYLTGSYSGTATFESRNGSSQTASSTGGTEIYFCKYDTAGNLNFVVSSGSYDDDEGADVKIAPSGYIYLSGFYKDVATFNSTSGSSQTLTSTSAKDAYVAKYDASGVLKWVISGGGPGDDLAARIWLDKKENIYAAGNMTCCGGGTATFGSASINNGSSWGGFVAKADSAGTWLWVNGVGTYTEEALIEAVTDDSGNVYAAGHINGNSSFTSSSPGSAISLTGIGGYDIFLAKMDSGGVLKWAKVYGSSANDICYGIKYSSVNHTIVMSGPFSGTTQFGTYSLPSAGQSDIYVCEFDHSGTPIRALSAGGTGDEWFSTINIDNLGNIFLAGTYNGTATFGSISLTSTGGSETFFAKIAPSYSFPLKATPKTVLCNDTTLLMPQIALDTNGISYQWLMNNAVLPGETNDTLLVDTVGTYRLVITNRCNEKDTSQPITITSSKVIINGTSANICLGDSIQLTASGATSYLWTPASGLSNAGISNPYAKPTDTTVYVVKGSAGSCSSYDTIVVNVNTDKVKAGSDVSICKGDSVQLSATNGTGFLWQPSSGLSDPNISNPYAKPADTTTYIVRATNGICVTRDTVVVNIIPLPQVDAGPTYVICQNDSVQLNATAAGTYHWVPTQGLSDSTSLNPYAHPGSTTVYYLYVDNGTCKSMDSTTVTIIPVTNVNAGQNQQVCFGDSVQLFAIGSGNYKWHPANGMNDTSIANPKVSPAITTDYIVQSGASGCTTYDTVKVTVNPKPTVDAGTDKSICENDSTTLNGVVPSGTHKWYPPTGLSDTTLLNPYAKPNTTTKYYLTADDGTCKNQDSMTVNVTAALHVNAGSDVQVCKGDSVQLTATGGGTNYVWTPSGGMNDSAIADPMVSPGSTIPYIVKSDNSGCWYYDTVTVTVNPKPFVDAGNDLTICKGQSAQINAVSTGADTYNWNPTVGLDDPSILQPTVLAASIPGVKYIITATNTTTGCFSKDSLMIQGDTIDAKFTADKNGEVGPLTVHFDNQSYNMTQSIWSFDSTMMNLSNEINPTYTFTAPGDYKVTLIATSVAGCSDSASLIIKVLYKKDIYIPNAFTPNGDDINDEFVVGYDETLYKKIEGSIWNRWGSKIYDFKMPGGNWWTGKFDGRDVTSDVYYYIISSEDLFGRKKEYRGTITLLR